MKRLVLAVRDSLSFDLLKPKYRKIASGKCKEFGHCYVATEALWHLIGGNLSTFKPFYAFDEEGDTHWWLSDGKSMLDPTGMQYGVRELKTLYSHGIRCGFLTKKPSKRAMIVINRILFRKKFI